MPRQPPRWLWSGRSEGFCDSLRPSCGRELRFRNFSHGTREDKVSALSSYLDGTVSGFNRARQEDALVVDGGHDAGQLDGLADGGRVRVRTLQNEISDMRVNSAFGSGNRQVCAHHRAGSWLSDEPLNCSFHCDFLRSFVSRRNHGPLKRLGVTSVKGSGKGRDDESG